VGGVEVSDLTVHAGAGGVRLVGPAFETCLAGTRDETVDLTDLHLDVPAAGSSLVGDGTMSLPGATLGDQFAVRFDALLPLGGVQGFPVDSGGSCPAQ
jgi:hypothetical protein